MLERDGRLSWLGLSRCANIAASANVRFSISECASEGLHQAGGILIGVAEHRLQLAHANFELTLIAFELGVADLAGQTVALFAVDELFDDEALFDQLSQHDRDARWMEPGAGLDCHQIRRGVSGAEGALNQFGGLWIVYL